MLRKAGAIILGKTNMTEFANRMSTEMWAGYSSRGGQVLNPYGDHNLFLLVAQAQVLLLQLQQILPYYP
jgi:Asp-tRNA(Asn)/Glu-tRNA(Gln) amidotransferase A subunit family amidase